MKKTKTKKSRLSGLRLAAIYSFPPHELGFCGPQNKKECKVISNYFKRKVSSNEVKKILRQFEAAFSYLQLIALKNKIRNPFDKKVVEALWIGNELLEKVNGQDIRKMVLEKFAFPELLSEKEALRRIKKISSKAKPHHSFHVYVFGTITGRVSLTEAKLKDICRISWGEIKKIKKTKVIVKYQPIIKNKKFKLGEFAEREIKWDRKIVPELKEGDKVSFHWDFLCQKLSQKQVNKLKKYTQKTLDLLK